MLTILDKSIVDALKAGNQEAEVAISTLSLCCQHAREGTHVLIADRKVFTGIRAFHSLMDRRTAATLKRAEDKLPQLGQIKSFAKRAIRVERGSAAPVCRTNGDGVELSLSLGAIDHQSSLLSVPMLLVENLNDGLCYAKLAETAVKSGIISDLQWLATVPLRFELVPGGGHTISGLYNYHKSRDARVGLAIVDSDIRYPGGSLGKTAHDLVTAVSTPPVSSLLEHHVIDVRTIENFVPRAELHNTSRLIDKAQGHRAESLNALFGNSPFWKFLPIKSGVRCFELGLNSAESAFWTALLGPRRCSTAESCTKKSSCETFIVFPLSSQLIAKISEKTDPLSITERCIEGLSDNWRRLITLLYSFFCGTERITVL